MTPAAVVALLLWSAKLLQLSNNNNNERAERQGLRSLLGSEGILPKESGSFLFCLRHPALELCAAQSGLGE